MSERTVPERPGKEHAPLKGVRVVEFGWVMAGTLPGMLLGDLGAEVIKVESAHRIDLNRQVVAINGDAPAMEQSPRFHSLNRGKLGMAVDIRSPEGREVVRQLVSRSNVVIENFSPGVLEKFDLGYSQLTQWRPDLIMASISAAGQSGPWSTTRGYALTVGALSGFSSLVGYEDGPPLGDEFMGPDVVAALHATVGILAALRYHRDTGIGQYIDVSMLESMSAVLAEPLLDAALTNTLVTPMGVSDPSLIPHGMFPCAGDDNWVSISVGDESQWLALCAVIGAPEFATDPDFKDHQQRRLNRERIDVRIGRWTRDRTKYDAARQLQVVGVGATPVLDMEEHVEDPGVERAGLYEEVEHPALGEVAIIATPWSSEPEFARIRRRAPQMGEHNAYVLCDILGLSQDEYRVLVESGVLT